jgi:hypothetical protein
VVQAKPIEGPELVRAGEAIQLLLIQPPEPNVQKMERDEPRGDALAMLAAVLAPNGPVCQMHEDSTAVVLVPELAFASGDLMTVREQLAESERRVILVAGFGLTDRDVLAQWHAEGADKAVKVVSPLDRGPLLNPTARVNGAWVLVNQPGVGVHGWAHVKTFPEQRFEKSWLRSARGCTVPLIRLGPGLTIVPLICSELLQDDSSGQEPEEFAARAVATELLKLSPARALVATVSWQSDPGHQSWSAGLNRLFADPRVRPALRVAIANHALESDDDKRRSLSGVVADVNDLRAPTGRPYVLKCGEGQWAAQLLRTSLPGVAAGELRWGANTGASGRDVWDVAFAWRWDAGGLKERDPADAHAVEIGRALARVFRRGSPVEQTRCAVLAHEAQHVRGLISSLWAQTARDGLAGTSVGLEPDTLAPTLCDDAALVQAAEVTAVLPRDKDGIMDQQLPIGDGGALAWRRVVPLIGRRDVALVWYSDRWTAAQQYAQLVKVVASLGTSEPLVVVGGSTLRGKRPATGPVEEGSLVRAGYEGDNITLPRSGVAGWLSADDLVGAVEASCDEPALIASVQSLIDRALSQDDSPGGSL